MIFSSRRFFQKTNERIRLYYYDTSGRLVFVRFLEEIEDAKKICFEINWPLTTQESATKPILKTRLLKTNLIFSPINHLKQFSWQVKRKREKKKNPTFITFPFAKTFFPYQ